MRIHPLLFVRGEGTDRVFPMGGFAFDFCRGLPFGGGDGEGKRKENGQ